MTHPLRTLLDLAAALPSPKLERAMNEAQVRRLATNVKLRASIRPGVRGAARLRAAVDGTPTPTRSEAERRLLTLVAAARLTRPVTNVALAGHEVDALWVEQGLVVEVDGYAAHGTRAAFERDRVRDADLALAGYTVLRTTWRQLTMEPEALVARLAAALVVSRRAASR